MRVRIIRQGPDMKRKRWEFKLYVNSSEVNIWLEAYFIEEFDPDISPACGWLVTRRWERLKPQGNSIMAPPLPDDVVAQAQLEYIGMIKDANVQT